MDPEFQKAMQRNPHLKKYVVEFNRSTGKLPEFVVSIPKEIDKEDVNLLLPVGDPVFIHLYGTPEMGDVEYRAIEPQLSATEQKKYDTIMNLILEKSAKEPVPNSEADLKELILKLFNESVSIGDIEESGEERSGILSKLFPKNEMVSVSQMEYNHLLYHIERNIIGSGAIEPVIRDPYLEDIHSIGVDGVFIVHKVLDMMKTNLSFGDDTRLDNWLRSMSERIGRPVSDSKPIADGALPDGSRINIIYSPDVSRRGSSFTMRKFSEVPISIIQLINWGSISCEMAAYMWMCLENGMSIFFSGETASGKTTMLNACLCFVNPKSKVYSAEDTAEVQPPQPVWQQLITREDGPPDSRVDTFTLLKAALRSRPNYIIVGEIRGAEGSVAFQAMQCIRDGYIAVPGRGPVHIRQLYDKYSHNAEREDAKYKVDLTDHEIPVYTSDAYGRIVESRITSVLRMDEQQLIKIYFDTGEIMEVTPNHRFLLEGGEEVTAQDLLQWPDLPDTLLPPSISWHREDACGFDFLDGWNILKDHLYDKNIEEYRKTGDYKTDRRKFSHYFSSRNRSIPFEVYQKVVDSADYPDSVQAVRKGARGTIAIPCKLTDDILRSLAGYILGYDSEHHPLFRHVIQITPDHIGDNFWKAGRDQLRIVFEEMLKLSEPEFGTLPGDIWYCIGRLAGDDSLYVAGKKNGSSDFRWQIRNKNEDEGIRYAQHASDVIPNDADSVITEQRDGIYTTRICCVDRSFVDWLVKNGFILVNEDCQHSSAVRKRIPIENISNINAYIAGILDSDCTVLNDGISLNTGFITDNESNDERLLFDQLRLVKCFENDLFPEVNCVEFQYHGDYADHVDRYTKFCKDLGLNVLSTCSDRIRGIVTRVEFSSSRKQGVWKRWAEYVVPYMYCRDKIQAVLELAGTGAGSKNGQGFSYDIYKSRVHKNYLPHLSMLAGICGYTLISESHECFDHRYFRFSKQKSSRIIHVDHGQSDHTYDISMEDGSYYIGGRQTMGYVYDTGHPVVATFHASAVKKMIQRLTGDPINVPVTFVDNLNVAMILQAVYRKGKFLRRCLSIEEIEGYYEEAGGVVTRAVFQWDPETDTHKFRGLNNSFILEDKIATILGYEDKRKIYDDLFLRARILEEMKDRGIEEYHEVHDILVKFYKYGVDGLPFLV